MSIEFGQRLQYYRRNCEFTQKNIADALNIDRSTYAYYERGTTEPDLKALVKIAKILGVTTSHLIPHDGEGEDAPVTDRRVKREQKEISKETEGRSSKVYNLSRGEKEILAVFRALDSDKRKTLYEYSLSLAKE